jgi:hypothetical protein
LKKEAKYTVQISVLATLLRKLKYKNVALRDQARAFLSFAAEAYLKKKKL